MSLPPSKQPVPVALLLENLCWQPILGSESDSVESIGDTSPPGQCHCLPLTWRAPASGCDIVERLAARVERRAPALLLQHINPARDQPNKPVEAAGEFPVGSQGGVPGRVPGRRARLCRRANCGRSQRLCAAHRGAAAEHKPVDSRCGRPAHPEMVARYARKHRSPRDERTCAVPQL